MNDFCIFIISHGRAESVITLKTLKKHGYTGKIYIVIDNEDKTAEIYKKLYGNMVIQFDKKKIAEKTDAMDNFNDRRTPLYARNACFEIAKKLNIKYFMFLDDDCVSFTFRFTPNYEFIESPIKNMNKILEILLKYYKRINAKSIAMSQGGDYIGGNEQFKKGIPLKRKAMCSFICDTKRQIKFIGTFNDDVNTYILNGSRGDLYFTILLLCVHSKETQQQNGGITEIYKKYGTYVKSFYTVMTNPSSVKVTLMNTVYKRLHHKVYWNYTVPKIINERYKNK